MVPLDTRTREGLFDKHVWDCKPLLAPMLEHVDQSTLNDQPFSMIFLTTIQHGGYENLPNLMKMVDCSDDKVLNEYLNTVKYTDDLLAKMMSVFESRGLLNETLFVMMGDHGTSFHEYGNMGTYNLVYDQALRVPVMFYTENSYWKPLKQNQNKGSNWSLLDVLSMILEMLTDTQGTVSNGSLLTLMDEIHQHEGRSMFQPSSSCI